MGPMGAYGSMSWKRRFPCRQSSCDASGGRTGGCASAALDSVYVRLSRRPGVPLELRLDMLREYTEKSAAPSPGGPVSVGRRCCETSGGGGTKRRGLGQRGERGVVQAGESSGGFTVSTVAQRAGRGEGLLSTHTVTHTTLLHSNRKTISRTLAELGAPYLFFTHYT